EADDSVLRSDVRGLMDRRDEAVDRSGIDDASAIAALHAGQRSADGVKRGRQIDGEDGVPAIDGKALGGRGVLDANVVDEDIDRAEALFGIADQLCALLWIGKVGRVEENLDAVLLAQPPGERLGLFGRGDTV